MKIMIAAHGHEHVDALIVDVDPTQILDLMTVWPEITNLAEMTFYDGGDWVDIDPDAADGLQSGPFLSFDEIDIRGEPARVQGERMVVDRTSVHWRGYEKYSDAEVFTNSLDAKDLRGLKTGMELMNESIRTYSDT